MKLSIVIPCYNEADNIPLLIKNLDSVYKPDIEIILVDNGSTDDTLPVLYKELKSVNNVLIRSIKVEKNIGYGNGIMAGVKEAKGEIIAWTHADLQTDVKDVYNGYEMFKSQSDQEKIFLKGNRKNRLFIDQILISLNIFFLRYLLRLGWIFFGDLGFRVKVLTIIIKLNFISFTLFRFRFEQTNISPLFFSRFSTNFQIFIICNFCKFICSILRKT